MHSVPHRPVSRAATIEGWCVVFALAGTVLLVQYGFIAAVLDAAGVLGQFASVIAGALYALFVTTPVAIGSFLMLAQTTPAWQIALWGALGAGIADFLLTKGVRSPLVDHLLDAAVGRDRLHAFARRSKRGPYKWLAAFFGATLIAVPLPMDEEGIALLGVSHFSTWQLVALLFGANFVGIFLLVSAAHVVLS